MAVTEEVELELTGEATDSKGNIVRASVVVRVEVPQAPGTE